jgi:opacity protein-like surface antigen
MQRIFIGLLLLLQPSFMQGQNWHISIFAGNSNYQGDLQQKRYTLQQAQVAFGIGARYEITEKLFARVNFTYAKIAADDNKGTINTGRNLSFSSPIAEGMLGVEYDFFSLYERSLTPYVFAGIAGYHFNPSTIDIQGRKVFLQPLGTEGQGFYLGRKKYPLSQMAIPIGGGLRFALSENIRIGLEVGFRKLFTDYLDDVSTTYADDQALLLNNGPQALELAFRAVEIKPTLPYPGEGAKRGNPKSKDWYYFSGLTVSFRLVPGSGNSRSSKSKLGCPANVY